MASLTHSCEAFDDKGKKRKITEIAREDAFPPIIDLDTSDAVQRVLVERASLHAAPPSPPHERVHGPRSLRSVIHAGNPQKFVEDTLFRYVDSAKFRHRVAEREDTGSRRTE